MLPGTFNPISIGPGVSFIGSDTYSRFGAGNVDYDFTIPGVEAGDLLVLALTYDAGGNNDALWNFNTASGGLDFTTIYNTTGSSTPRFVGYTSASGSLLRVQTSDVSATSWTRLTMVLAAYRGPTTLVASDTTTPLSITNTGSLTVLTAHAIGFSSHPTAVAPADYLISGQIAVGGFPGSATAIAHSFIDVNNPSATLTWDRVADGRAFAMSLFD